MQTSCLLFITPKGIDKYKNSAADVLAVAVEEKGLCKNESIQFKFQNLNISKMLSLYTIKFEMSIYAIKIYAIKLT